MIPYYLQQSVIDKATNYLNNDLIKIIKWAFQWKMSFNPDFSHPPLTLNNMPVVQTSFQEYSGMNLVEKLNFEEHISKVKSKVNKTIAIIRKLRNVFPWSTLLTIYRSFISSYLGDDDIW